MRTSNKSNPIIVWFREDLRLNDNPALASALATGSPIIPLFILDDETDGLRQLGGASRWWLHHSLKSLGSSIRRRGGRLIVQRGQTGRILETLVRETGSRHIVWNRRYGDVERRLDGNLKSTLRSQGVEVESFSGRLLNEPWDVASQAGQPFRVFTPYWKKCLASCKPERPLKAPARLETASEGMASDILDDWDLLPARPNWSRGFAKIWTPGETGARQKLEEFVTSKIPRYAEHRDEPATDQTSRLSPHLAFGEISPRQIWWSVHRPDLAAGDHNVSKFLSEIGWREFAYHLLYYNPDLATANFQSKFNGIQWKTPGSNLRAWQDGQTGYPIIDAAMRQLWQTGWMHNRCRLVVGSFLVKHLLTDWRHGEEWFWDTLVDADQANNPAGWQWIAGTGADAAPYFRVFNPVLQSCRFDPDGDYIRTYCPELAALDNKKIHEPWTATDDDLKAAGVRLGKTYPHPIVDHRTARDRALAAFENAKNVAL